MARVSRKSASSSSWYTVGLLFAALIAPLALLTPANAQSDEQAPLREDLGDGEPLSHKT